jgi:hypothetical protein
VFAGTGLDKGDRLKNLVGPEFDRFDPSGPKNVQVMARSPVNCRGKSSYSDMTYYTAPSGAGVWASGTNWWVSKLSEECSPLPSTTTTSSSTTSTFPVTPKAAKKAAICPKQAVIDMTENVLNLFGVGPAARTQPSTASNLRELNAGLPTASDNSDSTPTTRSRTRTRTRSTESSSNYAPTESPSTEPSYSPPYTYSPPTVPPRTAPTRRSLIGGG